MLGELPKPDPTSPYPASAAPASAGDWDYFGKKIMPTGATTAIELSAPRLIPTIPGGSRTSANFDATAAHVMTAAPGGVVSLALGVDGLDFGPATMAEPFTATFAGSGIVIA